jgi:hypothetical protein
MSAAAINHSVSLRALLRTFEIAAGIMFVYYVKVQLHVAFVANMPPLCAGQETHN